MSSSLPLIPLEDAIVLPGMALSFDLASAEANAAVDEALSAPEAQHGLVVLVPRHEGRFARIGVVAVIEGEPAMLPHGHRGVTLRALHRAELGRAEAAGGALRIDVVERPDPTDVSDELAEKVRAFRAVVEAILDARGASRIAAFLRSLEEPGALADTAGFSPDLSWAQKLELLETLDVGERLEKATEWLREVLGDLELKRRIRDDVTEGMEKSQREFLLRRQLDAIRKELGETGEDGDEIARYRERIAESRPAGGGPQGGRARARSPARPAPRGPRAPRSAPTSTGCSTCRGASSPTSRRTCTPRRRSWRPTTRA